MGSPCKLYSRICTGSDICIMFSGDEKYNICVCIFLDLFDFVEFFAFRVVYIYMYQFLFFSAFCNRVSQSYMSINGSKLYAQA